MSRLNRNISQLVFILCLLPVWTLSGQADLRNEKGKSNYNLEWDYMNPSTYVLENVEFEGVQNFDLEVLKMLSGLKLGDTINVPGDEITNAIKKLWKQSLFQNIGVKVKGIEESRISLIIELEERPRLSKFSFKGIKRGDIDNIKDKLGLVRGKVVTENLKIQIKNIVRSHFIEKGFYNIQVEIGEEVDKSLKNGLSLDIKIKKGPRVKIEEIIFEGSSVLKLKKLKKMMKNTKEKRWYSLFKSSKFIQSDFNEDKSSIISHYMNLGFRDAKIYSDTVYLNNDSLLNISINIDEGRKYYFGNISWSGNVKYKDSVLSSVLGIFKGETFDQSALERQLFANQNGRDISSLYMDNGYLFFQVNPVEKKIYNDTIDIEVVIYEGPQATVQNVIIEGNTKTNEHVIRRELRTLPGDKFSRADVIRSQREIANLGYFNPENMNVTPIPHPENGTVDIEYKVEEKPSDQVELSAGWGQNTVVGTLGVSFNNFSVKNIFQKGTWAPLPSGDGQRLSVRAQSTGRWYKSLSASFTEPWLGGKKPNSMTTAIYTTLQSLGTDETTKQEMLTTGAAVNFGFRLKVPDDFFIFQTGVEFQRFELQNFAQFGFDLFTDGIANNLNFQATLSRNSIDNPLYPRDGSKISFALKATPPYSLFSPDKDYANLSQQEKFKWVEYHKWKFDAEWYASIVGDLVLKARASFGFLGLYNSGIGYSPFERFEVGGDGISNIQLYGKEIVALRGYERTDIMSSDAGAPFFDKFTLELRYPLSLNPMSTIYTLAFLEGGNVWTDFSQYDPFDIKRTAGLGVRIFLPMFGVLGFDYGIGFDKNMVNTGSIFDKGRFSILLGFEPY